MVGKFTYIFFIWILKKKFVYFKCDNVSVKKKVKKQNRIIKN